MSCKEAGNQEMGKAKVEAGDEVDKSVEQLQWNEARTAESRGPAGNDERCSNDSLWDGGCSRRVPAGLKRKAAGGDDGAGGEDAGGDDGGDYDDESGDGYGGSGDG